MNRHTRTLVVVFVGLMAAGVSAYGVYGAIQRIPVREVPMVTRQAVVASKALPTGTLVTKESVKLIPWPADAPLSHGFENIDDVIGRGLISGVVENEPMTEIKLAPREAGAGLPPSIPKGMRAMSVKVNEVIGVAGFVVPGTHVDLMVTLKNQNDSLTRIVVSNTEVLTAGTRYDQENAQREGKPIPSSVVTLLVTPEDAERITLAQNAGPLMLALRNPLDTEPTKTNGVRTAGLFLRPGEEPPAPRRSLAPVPINPKPVEVVAAPPPPKIYTVEAIRAAKRTEEVVR